MMLRWIWHNYGSVGGWTAGRPAKRSKWSDRQEETRPVVARMAIEAFRANEFFIIISSMISWPAQDEVR